ncbi:MAG: GuaB3 family IMP dehydrogenase-related protein [Chloroflexi bacterium]|nr:GuaB3 family IMP dehydrogenase-related protein [Chloroflexota bacterium]
MVELPQIKQLRRAYGFDEVAIVPGDVTINPEQTNLEFALDHLTFRIPVLAAALDAVVDTKFAIAMHEQGGLAVMNLEGIAIRYDNPDEAVQAIIAAPPDKATATIQKVYAAPFKEKLIGERVRAIKKAGARCAVAMTPANTKRFVPLAVEAGADVVVVQSTVTTARHFSKSQEGLVFSKLLKETNAPVIVGNCVSYAAALEILESGVAGILVGVGPGAICTSREVLGIGVPQVTATLDCAAARAEYFRRTGRYAVIVTDGGMRTGGDVCKALACGADAVMLGTSFSQASEAPGRGYSWGMAAPHPVLPRGTRIKSGTRGPLKQILFGPTSRSDGTENLMGALQVAMGMCGAYAIKDFHKAQMVIAPAIKTEGKYYQLIGQV